MKVWVTGTRGIPNIIGGVETHCAQLLPRLAARGYKISVGCRKKYMTYSGSSYRDISLHIFRTAGFKSVETIFHTLQCVIAAWREKADIIHIHAIGPALVTPLCRALGMKVIVTHHGFDYERAKWGKFARFMLRLGEYLALHSADCVITVAPYIADRLHQDYKNKKCKIVCIPNGVCMPQIQTIGSQPNRKYILAIGRFVEEKGFHTLINAYLRSNLREKDISLVIAGDADYQSDYSVYLKKLGKEAGVEMPGKVFGNKLLHLMTGASLFVLPSTHEGLPIVLLEAMSCRLPVFVSDIPANRLPELQNDVFFTPGDVDALSRKLALFFKFNDNHIVEYDLTRYDWENIADMTAMIYDSLSPQIR